jgi:hypothetical protein
MFAAYKRDWSEFEGILYGMDIRDFSYNKPETEDIKAMYDGIDMWYTVNIWDPAPVYAKRGHKGEFAAKNPMSIVSRKRPR